MGSPGADRADGAIPFARRKREPGERRRDRVLPICRGGEGGGSYAGGDPDLVNATVGERDRKAATRRANRGVPGQEGADHRRGARTLHDAVDGRAGARAGRDGVCERVHARSGSGERHIDARG